MTVVDEKQHPGSTPISLSPYAELMRLHRPLGFYLNTSPYLVGIAFSASISTDFPVPVSILLHRIVLLIIWSFFLRCSGCVWNDIIDLDLDRQISRTKSRPLPRGAISIQNAVLLTIALFACGWSTLLFLPRECSLEAGIKTFFALLYPFGKRYINYPQITLGNIGWAVPMSMRSLGLSPREHLMPTVCMSLFIATVIIMVDVIYSCQDTEEDVKVGVKNMAVTFRDCVNVVIYSLFYLSIFLFASAGWLIGLGLPFFIVSVGGHYFGFGNLIKATRVKKLTGVESNAKSSCFLASIFWLLGLGIEYCRAG
uniref:Putative prenyltransferase n=1 Tax=Emericella variicolor TaxID=1549217 RepID=A0A1L7NQ65_EMEVA|nr:putative prenyltransferase [Aspergillus stellatus]